MTAEEKYFIQSALNHYWNDAHTNLQRKDLGDIERVNYQFQLRRSKELLNRDFDSEIAEIKRISLQTCEELKKQIDSKSAEIAELDEQLQLQHDHIKELKAEIERLKGESESRAKDAFSKACQFYENYVPEDYLPTNRPIL